MHQIQITRQAARILVAQLNNPEGWCKGIKTYSNACKIMDLQPLESLTLETVPDKPDDAWYKEPREFELTESQRDTVKQCLTHAADAGTMPVSKYSLELIQAFNLEE